MSRKNLREKYIPKSYSKIEKYNSVVYLAEDNLVVAFSGTRGKPDIFARFKTVEARDLYVSNYLKSQKEKIERKEKQKKQKEEAFSLIKVGDIFVSSWGYDQTNVDFYQLVALKGKTGTFRAIASKTVQGSEGPMNDRRVADVDNFISEEFKARINGDYINIHSYSRAKRIEDINKSFYCSWYY